jgi:N4-gp56 family major capsid protein
MATTSTSGINSGSTSSPSTALGVMSTRKVIASFQPSLYYEQLAEVVVLEAGNYYDRFHLFDQIATSSIGTLTEGTNPTGVAVTVTSKDNTPTQYGISVELTDLAVATTAFDLIQGTSNEVGLAMARKIDAVIQGVANAGTNVIYAGSATSRATLAISDVLTYPLAVKAVNTLRKNSAPKFADGNYRAILAVNQAYDLKANTSTGQFTDISKYANPERILNGEIGMIDGARLIESANVSTFTSTTTVYPALFAGANGLRVTYWFPTKTKTYINLPETSNLANPLGQKGTVGAKVNLAVSRVREEALARIETGATVL